MKIISNDAYSMTVETIRRPYDLQKLLEANNFYATCFPSLSAANRININFENFDKQRLENFLKGLN